MKEGSVFVPSGEVSAILSQLASSRLDLPCSVGLNGSPERYFRSVQRADLLGLSDHPAVIRRLAIMESYGMAVAMSGASSLDRVASVSENQGYVESRPEKPYGLTPLGESYGGTVLQDTDDGDSRILIQRVDRWSG